MAKTATACEKETPVRRGRGRPRSEHASRAILDAAVRLLAERGVEGSLVDDVAALAGVARATVYLRWPTKEQLIADAAEHAANQTVPLPDTGSLREDLIQVLRLYIAALTTTPLGPVLTAVIGQSRTPALREQARAGAARRRSLTHVVIARGVERGELPAGVDPDLVIDLVISPVVQRYFLTGLPIPRKFPEAVVDTVLKGVSAS